MKKNIRIIVNAALAATSFIALLILAGECDDFKTYVVGKLLAAAWIVGAALISHKTAPELWRK